MTHRLALLAAITALSLATTAAAFAADAASQPAAGRRDANPTLVRTLQDHRWTLQGAADASGQPIAALRLPGRTFAMSFADARLSVEGGCNRMSGGWRIDPSGKLMAGRLATTMMACETALMKADETFAALLAQPLSIAVTAGARPTLRLTSAGNEALVLNGTPTLKSLYGEPARIFLEVDAQRVDCKPPQTPPGNCLRVRERFFDKSGLPTGRTGEWTVFGGQIEGYTHTPGIRNVLRVDRYTRRPPATDGPDHVLVLDLVVESETIAR